MYDEKVNRENKPRIEPGPNPVWGKPPWKIRQTSSPPHHPHFKGNYEAQLAEFGFDPEQQLWKTVARLSHDEQMLADRLCKQSQDEAFAELLRTAQETANRVTEEEALKQKQVLEEAFRLEQWAKDWGIADLQFPLEEIAKRREAPQKTAKGLAKALASFGCNKKELSNKGFEYFLSQLKERKHHQTQDRLKRWRAGQRTGKRQLGTKIVPF